MISSGLPPSPARHQSYFHYEDWPPCIDLHCARGTLLLPLTPRCPCVVLASMCLLVGVASCAASPTTTTTTEIRRNRAPRVRSISSAYTVLLRCSDAAGNDYRLYFSVLVFCSLFRSRKTTLVETFRFAYFFVVLF